MARHAASYDLQVFADGAWRTIKGFRNQEDAIKRAQMLEVSAAREAVRVVHEVYDSALARYRLETIFRRSVLNQGRIETARSELAVARLLRSRRQTQPAAGNGAAPRGEDWPLYSELGIRLLALLVGAAVAMAIIDHVITG